MLWMNTFGCLRVYLPLESVVLKAIVRQSRYYNLSKIAWLPTINLLPIPPSIRMISARCRIILFDIDRHAFNAHVDAVICPFYLDWFSELDAEATLGFGDCNLAERWRKDK